MVKEKKIKVGVIGSSGFVGEELLLLISQHSQIDLCAISSRELAGKDLTKVFPNLAGKFDLSFSHPEDDIFTLTKIIEANISTITVAITNSINKGPYLLQTIFNDKNQTKHDAITEIYKMLRPGEPPT